jgi:hypothetical protein
MRLLSLAIGALSFIACHGAWYLSVNSDMIENCNPYLEGCFSISRAARSEVSIHFFRFFMGVTSALALLFWLEVTKRIYRYNRAVRFPVLFCGQVLAFLSCILLNLYISYLGTDGELYSWLRRVGIKGFYFSTYLSIILLMTAWWKIHIAKRNSSQDETNVVLTICKLIALAPILLGLAQLGLTIYFQNASRSLWFGNLDSNQMIDRIENVVEWWVTLFICLWFVFFSRHKTIENK